MLLESKNQKSDLYNKLKALYEYIIPKQGHEKSLATVMRTYSQTLVVETYADLQKVLTFVEKNQIKDFSIICLENLAKKNAWKNSLVNNVLPNELSAHFLSEVSLTDSLDEALKQIENQSCFSCITEKGIFIDPNKVLFYSPVGDQNIFLREAELKKIENSIITMEQEKKASEVIWNQLQNKKENIEAEKSALDKALRRDELKQAEISYSLQRLKNDLEKTQHESKQLANESLTIEEASIKISQHYNDYSLQHAAAKEKELQLQEKCELINKELDGQSLSLKQEKETLSDKEIAYRKLTEEKKKLEHKAHILDIQGSEGKLQELRYKEELQQAVGMQIKAKKRESEIDVEIQNSEKVINDLKELCQSVERNIQQIQKDLRNKDNNLQENQSKIHKFKEEYQRILLHKEQLLISSQNIENQLQERFQTELNSVRKSLEDQKNIPVTVDAVEKKLRSLRMEMENAGDINMTSIEEFESSKSRFEFLNQQINDLNDSKDELIKVISDLDNESRKLFRQTFQGIRDNFIKNFKILFNGGEADLLFTEAGDVLEAGIDIIAKPPGKQMRSISLLSGGEKCLTALALLFAIFEIKPAPFCILDEIDAPLDDTNVERFLNVVKQFIDRCQFIIITHNKRTMSIADILCGVSMEEKGVSKLLTLEFAKELEVETADER